LAGLYFFLVLLFSFFIYLFSHSFFFPKVFVQNSSKKEGPGFPFGYLKSNSAGTGVNLYVCPYNFPKLYPLLGFFFGRENQNKFKY